MIHIVNRILACCLAFVLAPATAMACFLEFGLAGGFGIGHPASVPVLVATQQAIDSGVLQASAPPPERGGPAGHAVQMRYYVVGQQVSQHAIAVRIPGPPYSALLVDSGVWIAFNGLGAASRFHAPAADDGADVLVMSDLLLPALLSGQMSVKEAAAQDLIFTAGPQAEAALAHFDRLITAYLQPGPVEANAKALGQTESGSSATE